MPKLRPLGSPPSVPTVSREPKPRMNQGPNWYVFNPGKDADAEVFHVDLGGESYHFLPGETKVKPRGGATAEEVAKHALGVYQLKGLKIRSE